MQKQKNAIDDAKVLTITRVDDGYVASLPLPEKLLVSNAYLGWNTDDGTIETIITFKFANIQARYQVVGISDDGRTLIGELIQQSEHRLPPPIMPDPKTMGRRS